MMSRPPIIAFVSSWMLAGCGTGMVPVEGVVKYRDGKPIEPLIGGMVHFEAVDAKTSSRGVIEAGGRFRMGTREDADGVPPGRYKIVVGPPAPVSAERLPRGYPYMHRKYINREQTPFNTKVESGMAPLELELD